MTLPSAARYTGSVRGLVGSWGSAALHPRLSNCGKHSRAMKSPGREGWFTPGGVKNNFNLR
jgi:hypothetical protein